MSGRKNVIEPFLLVDSETMDDDIESDSTNIQYLDNVSLQFIYTGTPTGTFYVDVSLDNENWVPLTLSPTPSASGAAGTNIVDLNQMASPWVRVRYDRTSGTGSLSVLVSAKMI